MSVLVTHLAPDFTKPAVLPNGTFNDTFNFHTEIAGNMRSCFSIRSISHLSALRRLLLTRIGQKNSANATWK